MVRPVVEASLGAALAGIAGASAVVGLFDQAMSTPAAIFAVDSAWLWSMLAFSGGLIWRASALVKGLEKTLENFRESNKAAHQRQTEIDEAILARLARGEEKWSVWEPIMIELKIRAGIGRDRMDAG